MKWLLGFLLLPCVLSPYHCFFSGSNYNYLVGSFIYVLVDISDILDMVFSTDKSISKKIYIQVGVHGSNHSVCDIYILIFKVDVPSLGNSFS